MTQPALAEIVKEDLKTALAKKIAVAERKSRVTMLAIIGLAALAIAAVAILFAQGDAPAGGQIIGIAGPTIAALLAYRKSAENAASIYEVTLNLDGRLAQLLEATDKAARAEGDAEGRAAVAAERQVRSTDIKREYQ